MELQIGKKATSNDPVFHPGPAFSVGEVGPKGEKGFSGYSGFSGYAGGPLTSTGSSGYLAAFTDDSSIGNSPAQTDGVTIGIGIPPQPTSMLTVSSAGMPAVYAESEYQALEGHSSYAEGIKGYGITGVYANGYTYNFSTDNTDVPSVLPLLVTNKIYPAVDSAQAVEITKANGSDAVLTIDTAGGRSEFYDGLTVLHGADGTALSTSGNVICQDGTMVLNCQLTGYPALGSPFNTYGLRLADHTNANGYVKTTGSNGSLTIAEDTYAVVGLHNTGDIAIFGANNSITPSDSYRFINTQNSTYAMYIQSAISGSGMNTIAISAAQDFIGCPNPGALIYFDGTNLRCHRGRDGADTTLTSWS